MKVLPIILFLLLSLFTSGCKAPGQPAETVNKIPEPAQQSPKTYLDLSCPAAAEIFVKHMAYGSSSGNELQWEQSKKEWSEKYEGKWIKWMLTVKEIGEAYGLYLKAECGDGSGPLNFLYVEFSGEPKQELIKYSRGDQIEIEGRIAGWDPDPLFFHVYLKDAVILNPK